MHCTLSLTVCKCTPCQRASFNSTTDSFSWGHDPYTLACKARPSSDRCWTSLSVSLSLSLSLSLSDPLPSGFAIRLPASSTSSSRQEQWPSESVKKVQKLWCCCNTSEKNTHTLRMRSKKYVPGAPTQHRPVGVHHLSARRPLAFRNVDSSTVGQNALSASAEAARPTL